MHIKKVGLLNLCFGLFNFEVVFNFGKFHGITVTSVLRILEAQAHPRFRNFECLVQFSSSS